MKAGLAKISKEIDKRLKNELAISDAAKRKIAKKKELFYYLKIIKRNKPQI